MKKFVSLALAMMLAASTASFASDEVDVKIPSFNVSINGKSVDSMKSSYPMIEYNGVTYFPMTWDFSRALGLSSSYANEMGLSITTGGEITDLKQTLDSNNDLGLSYEAVLPNFPISINGKTIDNSKEEYPILVMRGVSYFPLTWKYVVEEFGLISSWDNLEGLKIEAVKEPEEKNREILDEVVEVIDAVEIYVNDKGKYVPKYNRSKFPVEVRSFELSHIVALSGNVNHEEEIIEWLTDYADGVFKLKNDVENSSTKADDYQNSDYLFIFGDEDSYPIAYSLLINETPNIERATKIEDGVYFEYSYFDGEIDKFDVYINKNEIRDDLKMFKYLRLPGVEGSLNEVEIEKLAQKQKEYGLREYYKYQGTLETEGTQRYFLFYDANENFIGYIDPASVMLDEKILKNQLELHEE